MKTLRIEGMQGGFSDNSNPEPETVSAFVPTVKDGCSCPTEPYIDGDGVAWERRSPSCELHGTQSRYLYLQQPSQKDRRTVGVPHGNGH